MLKKSVKKSVIGTVIWVSIPMSVKLAFCTLASTSGIATAALALWLDRP